MSQADAPIVRVVNLTATEGSGDKLRVTLLDAVGATLAMPGNRGFSIHQSTAHPADFMVVERWADDQASRSTPTVLQDVLARGADEGLVATGPSASRWTRII